MASRGLMAAGALILIGRQLCSITDRAAVVSLRRRLRCQIGTGSSARPRTQEAAPSHANISWYSASPI